MRPENPGMRMGNIGGAPKIHRSKQGSPHEMPPHEMPPLHEMPPVSAGSEHRGLDDRSIDFYESVPFIVLSFFWMPPLAIAMIALRCYRNKKHDGNWCSGLFAGRNVNGTSAETESNADTRVQRYLQAHPGGLPVVKNNGSYFRGTIFFFIGVALLGIAVNSESFLGELFCSLGGIAMSLYGVYSNLLSFRLNRRKMCYDAFINKRGNTSIKFLAERTGRKAKKIRKDLRKMLQQGYLLNPEENIAAYLDGSCDLLVVTKNGVPLIPIEKSMDEEQQEQKEKEWEEAKAAASSVDEKALFEIQESVRMIEDDETVESLNRIAESIRMIRTLLEENPENREKKNVVNMNATYIPNMLDLLDKYKKSTTSEGTKKQISGMFHTLAMAFENIGEQLQKAEDNGTEIDIEVMRKTLERDGVLDSDFRL